MGLNLATYEAKWLVHLPAITLFRWFLTWWQKCGVAPACWRIVLGGNWCSANSSSMSKYEHPVTVFSEKKNSPINLSFIKPAHTFTLGLLSPTHMWQTCGFWLPQFLQFYLFTAPLTWNVASSEKHTWQKKSSDMSIFSWCPQRSSWVLLGHLALVHESFESCALLGGAFCVAYCALLNVECLSNVTDIFFRGQCLSKRFYMQQTACSLTLLSQNQILFCVGGWCPYCVLKRCCTAVRDCNSASHNMH
jgi:hypothetical protein